MLLRDIRNEPNVRSAKRVGNNTALVTYVNGHSAIRLHRTDVVSFKFGYITLSHGGWPSPTTKDRINKYISPSHYVVQRKYEWFVRDAHGKEVPFVSGMTITR